MKKGAKVSLSLDDLTEGSLTPAKGSPTFRGWALTLQDSPHYTWADSEAVQSSISGPSSPRDEEALRAAEEGGREVRRLWRTTKINRYYLPLAKLPPLGPDPRPLFARIPPRCCHIESVPRTERIIERWSSMPRLQTQLPMDLLQSIESADTGEGSLEANLRRRRQQHAASPRRSMVMQDSPRRRRKFKGDPYLRDFPNVPCECCEHPSPKPWTEKRSLSAVAVALLTAAMDSPTQQVKAAADATTPAA